MNVVSTLPSLAWSQSHRDTAEQTRDGEQVVGRILDHQLQTNQNPDRQQLESQGGMVLESAGDSHSQDSGLERIKRDQWEKGEDRALENMQPR